MKKTSKEKKFLFFNFSNKLTHHRFISSECLVKWKTSQVMVVFSKPLSLKVLGPFVLKMLSVDVLLFWLIIFEIVHYSAFLKDEVEPFDSSVSRGKHCLLKVGHDENGVSGLLVGLKSMRKNEVAQFLLSPSYAYGELGCPPRIPPNSFSILLFAFILIIY